MSKRTNLLLKRICTSLLAVVFALGLVPFQAFASPEQGGSSNETAAAEPAATASSEYDLIAQSEADGNCTAGEALVVYHASGAAKGSTGTLAIQSDEDPLAVQSESAGFEVAQTWDLSAADSAASAADAEAEGALSTQSEDGDTIASGSDVRVALVKNDSMGVADLVSYLESLDFVECAAPNYEYTPLALTNDPYLDMQYGLVSSTASVGYEAALAAEKAAGTDIGSDVVAVCDTGVDYNNPDLANQMWTDPGDIGLGEAGSHGYNGSSGAYDPMPASGSEFTHGTHCAGIIAAQSNNGQGVASIAGSGNTKIMGIRIANDSGALVGSAITAGYEYLVRAALAGVNVVAVNNSWGSSGGAAYDPVLDYLVNQAGKAGVISCFAAGNESLDVVSYYDTCQLTSPYAIVVAASNSKNRLSTYTCYDATAVDVAAPGSCILSTYTNSTTRNFDAILTKTSGDYDKTANPGGKADKLSYYNDIASLKNAKDESSAANDFQVVLKDKTTGDKLPDAAQGALTVSTKDAGGNAYKVQGQDAIAITIDYAALTGLGYKPDSVGAGITWTIDNPFKGTTGLTASEYSMNATAEYVGSVNASGANSADSTAVIITPALYGKDGETTVDLVDNTNAKDPCYLIATNDFIEFDNGTFKFIDNTSDTLSVAMNCYVMGGISDGTESFLLSGYGIGKNTNQYTDSYSAHMPYGYMSGTSMATPMISGCVGELATLYPDATALDLRGIICGGTTALTGDGDEDKIASGGRFTFDTFIDDSGKFDSDAISANTWSITTSRNIITVHGYALDDAVLTVDGVAVTPSEQTTDSITFTADTALFDGAAHRFDVTDASTEHTYKASYVTPNESADSFVYAHSLPVTDKAADDSLLATTESLYLADGLGTYFYSCTAPSDDTQEWVSLVAPGNPWTAVGETDAGNNRIPIKYAYCNGKIYAFAVGDSSNETGWPLAIVYSSVYDITAGTWSAWSKVYSDVSGAVEGFTAGIYNGSVYFAGAANLGDVLGRHGFLGVQQADGTYDTEYTISGDNMMMPFKAFSFGDTLYAFSAMKKEDESQQLTTYQPSLVSLNSSDYDAKEEQYVFENAGAIGGFDSTTDAHLFRSLMASTQTVADGGIIVAAGKHVGQGLGDLLYVNIADTSVTDLGSYGIDATTGYAVVAMAMFNGKLYIDAADRTLDSESSALYTIPETQASKIAATDAIAFVNASKGGTATVEDWRGNASDAFLGLFRGDTATWKATAQYGYKFLGWYDAAGTLVSTKAAYSASVNDYMALTAKFTSGTRMTRLWGQTALDTATAIIGEGEYSRGGTVVLATLDNFPDALTAAGIAGLANAPVLLTSSSELSSQTMLQLTMLRPTTIIVCGGTNAISAEIANAAKDAAQASRLYRCAGATRSGTACEIYRNAKAYTGGSFETTAFIATGANFADALSVAPLSYSKHYPVFLTEGAASISDETIQTMQDGGITSFYILGGTDVVSDDVVTQLKAAGFKFQDRLAGNSRYETSSKVVEMEIILGMGVDNFGVATGKNYKDALTGAALCGKNNAVLVLADDSNRAAIDDLMQIGKGYIATGYIFGGKAAVSSDTQTYIEKALG